MKFAELNLTPALIAALPNHMSQPTQIQQLAIPLALAQQDILALAQTGSGKTLAFGLPILQGISQSITGVQALVIVPTRELAVQVSESLQTVGQALSIDVVTLCGGIAQSSQVDKLASGAQLVVATPGRLLDLLKQQLIDVSTVKHLVLDEVDRLLDMGFWPDIERIISFVPVKRQTLLFSATIAPKLETLAQALLNNPQRIQVSAPNSLVDTIEEQLYLVNKGSKAKVLEWLLQKNQWSQVLVFISARDSADSFAKKLLKRGFNVAALHGDKDQKQRQETLNAFQNKTLKILIATDVLARGIDIDALPVVINLDLPASAPVYIHRVGRTARAGKSGLAISLVCHAEMDALNAIRTLTTKELPLDSLALFPVTDKPASSDSKRAPRDKKANRRTAAKKRRNTTDFKGKK
ncbi:MAG: DEAD/DEAH box helicase [Psychrobium sp.]|nr:DEAD/DEAH box helicase [Psychrobium sp.]